MMSPGEPLENGGTSSEGLMDKRKQRSGATAYGHTPLQAIHIFGRFMRLWSVYATYQYLSQTGIAIVVFMFICLLSSSAIFLAIQRPWKGRPLSTSQVGCGFRNKWRNNGTVLCTMGEGTGILWSCQDSISRICRGYAGSIICFSLWAKGSNLEKALRRVVARRVSLKTQWKRRLHAVTIASATCFIFPFAIWQSTFGSNKSEGDDSLSPFWAYSSTVLFGIVLTYYVDAFVEDRLHLIASSPKHLMVTAGCIIVLEVFYRTDFSLLGFLICASILGLGMFEATSLDRTRRGLVHAENVFTEDFDTSLTRNPLPS